MVKRTGPQNTETINLIDALKKKGYESKENIWITVAEGLEKPTRSRCVVNLSRLNRVTKENDVVIVPGKVLGSGSINHPITIVAWNYSGGAAEKLKQAKSKVMLLPEIIKQTAKGKHYRLIG